MQGLVRDDGLTQVEAAQLVGPAQELGVPAAGAVGEVERGGEGGFAFGSGGSVVGAAVDAVARGQPGSAVGADAARDVDGAGSERRDRSACKGPARSRRRSSWPSRARRWRRRRALPTALRDPRLSRAGNWLARHLTQALEALVRVENWLRTPNERELREPGSGDFATAAGTRRRSGERGGGVGAGTGPCKRERTVMNEAMRHEIVQRHQAGCRIRAIADELGISRGAVRRALGAGAGPA